MSPAVIPPTILPRIGALLRLLGSDQDGEALGAARALGRTLKAAGADWHTLADAVERPAEMPETAPPPHPPTPRRGRRRGQARPGDVDLTFAQRRNVVEALRRGLAGSRMTDWERTFAVSMVEHLQSQRWRLTERQGETLARLLGKVGEGKAWV